MKRDSEQAILGWLPLLSLLTGVFVDGAVASEPGAVRADVLNEAAGLRASRLADVRLEEATESHSVVSLTLADETLTVFLMPASIRTGDFEVFVQEPNGGLQRLDEPPPPKTVRGTIVEWPGSEVVGSLVDGRLTAAIRTQQNERWLVQPAASLAQGIPDEQHLLFRNSDVLPLVFTCGVEDEEPRPLGTGGHGTRQSDHEPSEERGLGFPTLVTEISVDSDVEFFNLNGSSVAATVDDIESVMVGVDAIYRSQVNISYVVNRIIIRTAEPDPYSSANPDTLRAQLRNLWESLPLSSVERDIVHLMTGRNLTGTVIGKAFIEEVCNRWIDPFLEGAYGLSQSRFSNNFAQRVALTAHELGHNWSGTHCDGDSDCSIMCATIGGCAGTLNAFGASAREDIRDHRNSRDCLNSSTAVTYVNASYAGIEDGSPLHPYDTFREGIWATDPNGTVIMATGLYDADRTSSILNRPMTLQVLGGTGLVVIGQ